MKSLWLTIGGLLVMAFIFHGCATTETKGPPASGQAAMTQAQEPVPALPPPNSPKHDIYDIIHAAKKLTDTMLQVVGSEIRARPQPPSIVVRPVENQTPETLNVFTISDAITAKVKDSNLFRFLQADYATSEMPGKETDYILTARLERVEMAGVSGARLRRVNKISLQLVNLKNGKLVWAGDAEY